MVSNMSDAVRILMVTTTLLAACYAQPTGRSRYCGTHLADALRLACGTGGYNPPAWAGDAASTNLSKSTRQQYYKSIGVGVATECCYSGCSWSTIRSYCAEPHQHQQKSKKSSGDLDFGSSGSGLSRAAEESGRAGLMAAAPEIEIESIRRSAPLFGTVSPEYLRLPRTLDEVPPLYQGMQGY